MRPRRIRYDDANNVRRGEPEIVEFHELSDEEIETANVENEDNETEAVKSDFIPPPFVFAYVLLKKTFLLNDALKFQSTDYFCAFHNIVT